MSPTDDAVTVARRTAAISRLRRERTAGDEPPVPDTLPITAEAIRRRTRRGVPQLDERPDDDAPVAAVVPLIGKRIDPSLLELIGRYMPVLRTSAEPFRFDDPAVHARASAARARREARLHVDQERHARVLAAADGVLRDVADLHAPQAHDEHETHCDGCDYGEGYDAGPPAWPCSTFDLVERHTARLDAALEDPTIPENGDPTHGT